VRAERFDEEGAEGGVFAFAEELPDVWVGEGCECGDFEFKEVILCGIEVDGVDAARRVEAEGEDVVAG
jgi:hypothetical protein